MKYPKHVRIEEARKAEFKRLGLRIDRDGFIRAVPHEHSQWCNGKCGYPFCDQYNRGTLGHPLGSVGLEADERAKDKPVKEGVA